MLTPSRLDRVTRTLGVTSPLLICGSPPAWAQSSGVAVPGTATAAAWTGRAATALAFILLVAIAGAIVVVARYVVARRQQRDKATILQSQLSDAIARETHFRGLTIVPRARISGWLRPRVAIEVAGEVPTPVLRETVMRFVQGEASRLRPDVITEDFLFIAPEMHRAS